jgi:hypothetical protein
MPSTEQERQVTPQPHALTGPISLDDYMGVLAARQAAYEAERQAAHPALGFRLPALLTWFIRDDDEQYVITPDAAPSPKPEPKTTKSRVYRSAASIREELARVDAQLAAIGAEECTDNAVVNLSPFSRSKAAARAGRRRFARMDRDLEKHTALSRRRARLAGSLTRAEARERADAAQSTGPADPERVVTARRPGRIDVPDGSGDTAERGNAEGATWASAKTAAELRQAIESREATGYADGGYNGGFTAALRERLAELDSAESGERTGEHEQGLLAASASGATEDDARAAAIAEYEPHHEPDALAKNPAERQCRKAQKRVIRFDCKRGYGHEGDCSPYTLPPTAVYYAPEAASAPFVSSWASVDPGTVAGVR